MRRTLLSGVTAILALVIAVPLAIAVAVFVTEMCPKPLRKPISFATELLAAIPSVIYGLWAMFVLVPILRANVAPLLAKYLGWTGLFYGPMYGYSMLAAGTGGLGAGGNVLGGSVCTGLEIAGKLSLEAKPCGAGAMVMVRPSLLKLAIRGWVPVTAISAPPSWSTVTRCRRSPATATSGRAPTW